MHHDRKGMRKSAADKANRLAHGDPHQKVDASSWTPPEPMNADVQTGMRPVSKRAFKRGGKVAQMEGLKAMQHMGRKPRKSGGRALTADSLINRSIKEANEEREGIKHVGAMKRGGAAHGHISHVDEVADKKLIKHMVKATALKHGKFGGGPVGDNPISQQGKMMRDAAAHKHGGRAHHATKGKVKPDASNINWAQVEEGYNPTSKASNYQGTDYSEGSDQITKMLQDDKSASENRRAHGGKADGHKVKWIQKAIKHPGALHKALHVPEGKKIPMAKIKKAEHSSNPVLAKRAHLAENLRSFHADGGHAGHGSECRCHKCWGGAAEAKGDRIARKHGGSAKGKGKTNIAINIHPHAPSDMGAPPMMPPSMPARPPMGGMPMGGMPMGGMPPGLAGGAPSMPPAGAGMPPVRPPMPPMGRKSGGRTTYPIHTGAGGGEARLDKIKAYGEAPPKLTRGR
jgi:hypothetical protein